MKNTLMDIWDFIVLYSNWFSVLFFAFAALGTPIAALKLHKQKSRSASSRTKKWFWIIALIVSIISFILSAAVSLLNESVRSHLLKWLTSKEMYGSLIWTIIALIIIAVLSRILRAALMRGAVDVKGRHKIRRTIQWVSYIIFVLCVILIWSSHLQGFGVFLGMFAAGVALSLQETLLCLAGWMLIVIKKPFDIGDRIQVKDITGDVIDIQTFQTHVLEIGNWVGGDQSTGRIAAIPNSLVFRNEVFNYTKGFPFIWNEFKTVVTFDSDWVLAKEIILKQAEEEAEKIESEVRRQIDIMQQKYAIRYQKLTPIVYTKIEDIGVGLTLRYLTPVRNRRGTTHQICESILTEFTKSDKINFAYPTQTIYTVPSEMKG